MAMLFLCISAYFYHIGTIAEQNLRNQESFIDSIEDLDGQFFSTADDTANLFDNLIR